MPNNQIQSLTVNGVTYDIVDNTSGYTTNTGTITKVQTNAGAHSTINVSSGAATFNVPTKTSHLTNDSGYLTSYTETDPTVPSWAKASSKPSYNFSEIDSKPTTISGYGITDAYTKTEVDNLLLALPEPMIFKGSLGTGGTITALPTAAAANEGFVYKVITDDTYASQAAKVGDTFVSDGSNWVLIPSGDEPSGTVTSIGLSNATNGGLTISGGLITSSGSITVGHTNVLTSAQSTSAVYPITIDKNGHIASYGSAVTIPSITLNGSSSTSPSFYAPTSAGTSGYVLTSSGSGAPSWSSAVLTDENVKTSTIVSKNYDYSVVFGSSSSTTETKVISSAFQYTENGINESYLKIGSNSKKGYISLSDASSYRANITPSTLTSTRTFTLPDASGTIALTSDIISHSTQTATLTTTWTSNQQTVTVSGVTSSNYVVVSPAPASYDDYCEAGIYCSAQGTNSLTFKCDTAPSSSLTVNVMIIG